MIPPRHPAWMPLHAFALLLLCVPVLGGCVGSSVGDIKRQCAMLDDPDPVRRMRALQWFDDLTFWKYTSRETLAAPSLTPCVVKTAVLIESDEPREAVEAAAALRTLVQMMGPREPETVVPIVVRTMERERAVLEGGAPDEAARSHAETMLWLLGEVHGLYEGRLPLHYDLPGEPSPPEASAALAQEDLVQR